MSARAETATIRFVARPCLVGTSTLVRLPETASRELPSRGQVAVEGSINDTAFRTVVEPDGRKGHWIRLDPDLQQAAGINAGAAAEIEIQPVRDWPEPDVPPDLASALAAAPQRIRDIWSDITPMARWEWVRWVNATANPATRQRRVDVTIDKMDSGKRRPCCFDLSACTDPALAKNGKLRDTS